jgi:Citrate transporter
VSGTEFAFFAILLTSFALLISERLRNDLVAILVILALAVSGVLKPAEALAGFASEPAIVVAAIFVLSAGVHRTGLSDTLGRWIGRWAGRGLTRAIAVIMPSVALLSAFTHHLTTTAVMLPVTLELSRERGLPASKLLMPLSFAASLGTTITIIGAPAFLIASSVLQQAGRPGLHVFSIAPIGLALTAAAACCPRVRAPRTPGAASGSTSTSPSSPSASPRGWPGAALPIWRPTTGITCGWSGSCATATGCGGRWRRSRCAPVTCCSCAPRPSSSSPCAMSATSSCIR